MKWIRILVSVCVLLTYRFAFGQDNSFTLTEQGLVAIIRNYHPLAKAAGLQVSRAEATIQEARGAFDPKLEGGTERKTYDGKNYYNYQNAQVTLPTWYGIDFKTGIENTGGLYLSPEATRGNISYAGVNIGVNNLLFDKRRAVLQQALAFRSQSRAEQRLTTNTLLYEALSAYWEWVRQYRNYGILTDAMRANRERLRFVKIEAAQGARAAIDTTEAITQLQSWELQQQAAALAFQNAGLQLANYLWLNDSTAFNWANRNIIPGPEPVKALNIVIPNYSLDSTVAIHPKIQSLAAKGAILNWERRLKAQSFIPKIMVGANVLNKGYNVTKDFSSNLFQNNYKLGVDVKLPLFMREARGAYEAAKIKIAENRLETDQTMLEVSTKIQMAVNEVKGLQQQLQTAQSLYDNYRRLYRGELMRFDAGESTLFLVNARETKMLEGAQKVAELETKVHKTVAAYQAALGFLN